MKTLRWRWHFLKSPIAFVAIVLFGCLSVTHTVSAQDQLPSSFQTPTGSPWTSMQAGAFAPTSASARSQCERAAKESSTDNLTTAECQRLEERLASGQCESVVVPDGIVHDLMSFRLKQRKSITDRVLKKHGHDTAALLCDLDRGVYGYFYVGSDEHCNNKAFVFGLPKEPTAAGVKTKRKKCRFVERQATQLSGSFVNVKDFNFCGCNIPGFTGYLSGGVQENSDYVCEE